jgi:hypothetical protein
MAADDFVAHGDILMRGGYLLTMDQAGDIPDGDVHISGGEIHAVGRGLDVTGAEAIDAGITTVHDWAHNIRGRQWAEAGLRVEPKIHRAEIEAARGLGLSVDTTMLAGNADMFGIMKVTQACENGNARHEFALSARDALRLATIEGARTLGLDSVTGSLAPSPATGGEPAMTYTLRNQTTTLRGGFPLRRLSGYL